VAAASSIPPIEPTLQKNGERMVERDVPGDASLVVVGSSAGGIEALIAVLSALPEQLPASIVIAQHLQPTRDSHLGEILAPRSRLPVRTVEGRMRLEPGVVYVVPPDRHVAITDHEVSVEPAGQDHPAPSIDRLLRTAADVFTDRLIAVILSGMGTDGAAGAADVKAAGGTVIIQNPETATHPAMPRALPPTIVDFVADADRIGELLGELVASPLRQAAPDDERLLRAFLEEVRDRTGIDFSAYKAPTIQRRLQRRLVATGSLKLRDYVRYLHVHPDEYQRLASAFLIKVTQFFRDGDLFEHLGDVLLPRLIKESRDDGRELRLWSGGCATGEEAYSIAILVADALGPELDGFDVRIFATDLDEDAITYARRGIYPASSLANVPPDMLDRHFTPVGVDFEVAKTIRSMVVFGQHDLGQRAPFPRIDLALCRNVLIYFTPELQKRALQLFAYSLREGGYLALGKAESTTPLAEHFIVEHPRLKIYRRAGDRIVLPRARIGESIGALPDRPARRGSLWTGSPSRPGRVARPAAVERPDSVLLALPIGVVVVDEHYDITFLNGAARRFLGIHGAAIGSDFVHLAHGLPSDSLRQGIDTALRGESSAVTVPIDDAAADSEQPVMRLTFTPQRRPEGGQIATVVVGVIDVTADFRAGEEVRVDAERLRQDLGRTRDRIVRLDRSTRELLSANEELTNINAMLRTANEELLLANEEVQAATEEVETLNEELQATNEELETLNEELQATVEELNTTNDDLEARSVELRETAASLHEQRARSEQERLRLSLILDGMSEAVMAIDPDGRTVATNRAYDQLFGDAGDSWIPRDDAGAPLPADAWPQHGAARGDTFSMSFTVTMADGSRRWLEANTRGAPDGRGGGVVVIRDITDRSLRHLQERFMAAASHELRTPIAAAHGLLQLAERRLNEGDTAEVATYLARAIAETRRLSDLITRLFDVALVQHGRFTLHKEPLDLVAVVRAAVELEEVLEPDVRFRMEDAPTTLRMRADPLRLQQAILNILTNAAVHGSPDGGEVEIRITRADGEATIDVRDHGPGIPPGIADTAFLPFATDGERAASGLGLGLYLANEMVVSHGGRIEHEAAEDGGARVMIRLPMKASRRTGGSSSG